MWIGRPQKCGNEVTKAIPAIFETNEGAVLIRRSVAEVFRFYRDFRNLALFKQDVIQVDALGDGRWRWTVITTVGVEICWPIVVTRLRAEELIAYEMQSALAAVRWEVSFAAADDVQTTRVCERMTMPGGELAIEAFAAVGGPPAVDIDGNLKRLKEILETG